MKQSRLLFLVLVLIYTISTTLHAQSSSSSGSSGPISLYVSKQTGASTPPFAGGYAKTTDRYEHGDVTLAKTGPITYTVDPNDLSIGTNSTKAWNGNLGVDVAASPAAGSSANASISATYSIFYSHYIGSSSGGGSTEYSCPGCAAHTGTGYHEIKNETGNESQEFIVYSIKATIGDISCSDTVVTLHADVFPYGGTLNWTTPFGPAVGNDVQINVGAIPNSFDVSVVYTIGGVTYTDTKHVQKATLTGFTLPCCIDTVKNVKDIAILTFDGPCHPQVVFNPATISPSGLGYIPLVGTTGVENKTATATADGVTLTANTQVVNTNITFGFTPINYNFTAWKDRLVNCLVSGLNGGVSPCSPSGSWIPTGSLGYESNYMCCPGASPCVQTARRYYGQANWSWGMTCHFPFFGVPYVASLDAVISAGIDGQISLNAKTNCTTTKVCAGLDVTARIGGGVGATVLAGAVSADLQVQISAGVSGQACVYPLPLSASGYFFIGRVKVVGTVTTFWGLTSTSVEAVIWDGYTSPTLSYP